MKLLTFKRNEEFALGVELDNKVIDIEKSLSSTNNRNIPLGITEVIQGGKQSISILDEHIKKLNLNDDSSFIHSKDELIWGPCVIEPNKIICVGLNYRKHADETNSPYPEYPILFNKFNNTLTGHKSKVSIPKNTKKLDYEVELGIVIGKKVKNVSENEALDFVFGYCIANDLSARDLQFMTSQWLLGKSCDDFTPLGPYLVTADEVGNPQCLSLKTLVNGHIRQNSNTSDMIFPCSKIISFISQHMTLNPGDVILTGTPEGVVLGYPHGEQSYLKPGDKVTLEIEKLGSLVNYFVEG
ncbi:fumarylacetoacetate hydrolase family protein [Virgibacillus dakarensis]|uniref:fumarylacetoacetate hydrolase family protein n=1 Tax=Virgibacillus dakarensis TaxID=1917889 RepID=UPI000B430161|nr:fumarylacetoacetate hydrolase family protein [Virgibacillus dakarensis]